MRFEVPQFIEIEDKIFGPFTWKQFVYLAGGGGAALITYFTLPTILFALIGIPIVALAGFLAFHKVNNRPFSIFLESFFTYFTNTKLYLWRKEKAQTITTAPITPEPSVTATYIPPTSGPSITKLSRKLELDSLDREKPEPPK